MKIIDVDQGSPEWLRARLGIPSASGFNKIVTPGGDKCKKSVRDQYMQELLAEELLGEPIKDLGSLYWIERGKMLEPDAAKLYEMQTDRETTCIGFITNDEGTVGCSPDRFTKDGGLLEIKCPAPQTHVGYMMCGFDEKYKPQVQGQLWITGLEWCEWFSYHPEMPPVTMRIHRDEEYIAFMSKEILEFARVKAEALKKLKATNYEQAAE